jgi:hypothetical protein
LPVQADDRGYVETPYSLAQAAPGQTFRALYVFRNTAACPGPGPRSWSNAVRVTVQ